MQISELSDRQVDTFIKNYRARDAAVGGKFPLSELLLEQKRRIVSPFPPDETAKTIVRLAHHSPDGLVSYKDVWEIFRPGKVWTGNAPRSEMAKALGRVIAFCIDGGLPIISTLVVRSGSRDHSDEAITNIYNEAKSLDLVVGPDPKAFVLDQQSKARQLALDWKS